MTGSVEIKTVIYKPGRENKMTNENLTISCSELLELRHEFPLEISVIMEMLLEAGEECLDLELDLEQIEHAALQSAA